MTAGLWMISALLISSSANAETYGKQEHVRIDNGNTPLEVIARLDPAAGRSVLGALNIKYVNHTDGLWVSFTVDNGSVLPGRHAQLQRPVIKDQLVKQRDGSNEHQPLVEVTLCVGTQPIKARLSLVTRTGYTAPLVLGKPELEQLGASISVGEFTHEPVCAATETPANLDAPPPSAHATPAPQRPAVSTTSKTAPPVASAQAAPAEAKFTCDGRTRCPQMHSCEEATFFLHNCPNTQMDGDHDGIPCEDQLCGH